METQNCLVCNIKYKINFSFDKTKVKKLIDYITKEPERDEHNIGYKFPFMSAEILNSDVSKILDYFLIADNELENKEGLLKNIDNELELSDDFPNTKKSNEGNNEDYNQEEGKPEDEFKDIIEEKNENEDNQKPKIEESSEEKNVEEEVKKSMELLSLDSNDVDNNNEKDKDNDKENENEKEKSSIFLF